MVGASVAPELLNSANGQVAQTAYQAASVRTKRGPWGRSLLRTRRFARFISYCSWSHRIDYHLTIQMRVYQAS
eukprot:1235941-Lingulodinium_polyedra.AAC.1